MHPEAVRRTGWRRSIYRRLLRLESTSKHIITFGLVALVGVGDLISGEEISFSIFYLAPIAFSAWFQNRTSGYVAATLSAVAWYAAEMINHAAFSNALIPVWNAGARWFLFLSIVSLIDAVRGTETRLI